jgi:outer membrane autotransporter protein
MSALTSTINTVNTAFLAGTSAFVSSPTNPKADQVGSGAWGRAIGGSSEISSSSVGTIDVSKMDPGLGLIPDPGKQTCDTTVKQDFAGFQVGYDVATLNAGGTGASLHLGFTAGYLGAFTRDTTAAGSYYSAAVDFFDGPAGSGIVDTPPGSLKVRTEVPFVGAYMAFIQKGFYLDGLLRLDFHQDSLSGDPLTGLNGQSLNARGISLTVNAGQNIQLGSGWYIEPSAGVVVSRVDFDTLKLPGFADTLTTCFACGTVSVDDITSVLGRATLKIGTAFAAQGITYLPFFAASVFHEFEGDVTATSVASGSNNPFIENLSLTMQSTGGLGTYSQFGVGTSAVLGNTGWLGYGRFDYRTGDNIEGWSVNTGLRYQW